MDEDRELAEAFGEDRMRLGSIVSLASDAFHLTVTRLAGECQLPRRRRLRHERVEFVFVEAGQGWKRVEGRNLPVVAGDLFLVAPGESHAFVYQDGLTTWVVALEADDEYCWPPGNLFLAAFLPLPLSSVRSFHVEPPEHARWIVRLTSLAEELRADDIGAGVAAHALMRLLMVDVARLAGLQLNKPSSQAHPILGSVFNYIDERFRLPIGLADVAKAVGRSPSYLTDLVRRETGRTVLQWIIHRRIAEARRLLMDPSVRVKDVAPRIGYDDTGHFIRQFRRLNGLTPQQWRVGGQARARLCAGRPEEVEVLPLPRFRPSPAPLSRHSGTVVTESGGCFHAP